MAKGKKKKTKKNMTNVPRKVDSTKLVSPSADGKHAYYVLDNPMTEYKAYFPIPTTLSPREENTYIRSATKKIMAHSNMYGAQYAVIEEPITDDEIKKCVADVPLNKLMERLYKIWITDKHKTNQVAFRATFAGDATLIIMVGSMREFHNVIGMGCHWSDPLGIDEVVITNFYVRKFPKIGMDLLRDPFGSVSMAKNWAHDNGNLVYIEDEYIAAPSVHSYEFPEHVHAMLTKVCDYVESVGGIDNILYSFINFDEPELNMIKEAANLSAYYNLMAIPITYLFPDGTWEHEKQVDEINKNFSSVIDWHFSEAYPWAKLSRSDFDYISEYLSQHGYNYHAEDDPNPINLLEIMDGMRFGNTLRCTLYDLKGHEVECLVSLQIHKPTKMAKIIIQQGTEPLGGAIVPNCSIIIKDIEHFRAQINQLEAIYSKVHQEDFDFLVPNYADYVDQIHPLFMDNAKMLTVIFDVIDLFLMIQLFPKHIMASSGKAHTHTPNKEVGIAPRNPDPKVDSEYVVVHIIRTEYRKDEPHEPTGRTIDSREYVTPTWTTREHWRTLKDGRKVRVKAHSNNRQLEMSKKKIKLVL